MNVSAGSAVQPGMQFRCSICDEPSEKICAWCTKDACNNHLCLRCGRCSDCCQCESTSRASVPQGG